MRQDGSDNLDVAYYENEEQGQVSSFDRVVMTAKRADAAAFFNTRVRNYYLRNGGEPPACALLPLEADHD